MKPSIVDEMLAILIEKKQQILYSIEHYHMLEDTNRQSLLEAIFDKIEGLEHSVQELDLLFISKFDLYKKISGIKSVENLSLDEQKSFKPIQIEIRLVESLMAQLADLRRQYEPLKAKTLHNRFQINKQSQVISAYKKTNK